MGRLPPALTRVEEVEGVRQAEKEREKEKWYLLNSHASSAFSGRLRKYEAVGVSLRVGVEKGRKKRV